MRPSSMMALVIKDQERCMRVELLRIDVSPLN